jgi:hypothetical protein
MCTARPNWLSLSTTFFNKEECHKVYGENDDVLMSSLPLQIFTLENNNHGNFSMRRGEKIPALEMFNACTCTLSICLFERPYLMGI